MASERVQQRARRTERAQQLRISEIFHSLQGESRSVGWPTVFVRLTGCPLRCRYCDTAYAFSGGRPMLLDDVIAEVARYDTLRVTVTGGEPLAQPACRRLLGALCDRGFEVSLETGGTIDIADIDARVCVVMDIKTPGSGEVRKNRYENIGHLRPKDQVKFVIVDRTDYEWAKAQLEAFELNRRCEVLLSPSHGELSPGALGDWILEDRLQVRLQIQLHKYLWGEVRGR